MRMGEKLQDLRKLIVNALILLLLGTGLFWAGTLVSNSGQTTTISQEEVYARLQEINELCTMEYQYSKVGEFDNSLQINGWNIPLTQKHFLLTYSGSLKAGVDLEQATVTIDDHSILVELPPVSILSHAIEEDSIEVYDESGSIFNPISVSDYAAFANQQKQVVEEEAIERGLLSQAATRTQQCIRDLILLTPEVQENYTLDVRFQEA